MSKKEIEQLQDERDRIALENARREAILDTLLARFDALQAQVESDMSAAREAYKPTPQTPEANPLPPSGYITEPTDEFGSYGDGTAFETQFRTAIRDKVRQVNAAAIESEAAAIQNPKPLSPQTQAIANRLKTKVEREFLDPASPENSPFHPATDKEAREARLKRAKGQ